MARPKTGISMKSITVSIPVEVYEAIEDLRWALRKERADIYRDAVASYVEALKAEAK